MNQTLNTRQVAERLGVCMNTIYKYLYSGILKGYKLGGNGKSHRHWRIKVSDLDHFISGAGEEHAGHTNYNDSE